MSEESLLLDLERILQSKVTYGQDFDFSDRKPAAVLTLFRGKTFLTSEVLLILRSMQVTLNPGQVAFPGGIVEPEDNGDVRNAAVRECFEEVGLQSKSIQPLGLLPELPTVSDRVKVIPVIGIYQGAHQPFVLDPREVSKAEWVKLADLKSSRTTERRMVRGVERELPVFAWGSERMWGLSALIFDLILRRYDRLST